MENKDLSNIANFLYEMGILAKTPRSGFYFLGSGEQSVAEHINRVCYIGYCLAKMNGMVESGKVVQMCLFHDVSESRISDLNYVHQKYTERFEEKAHTDMTNSLPFGTDIKAMLDEYELRESLESMLVKDADNLEFIISLKEQYDIGNERANTWIEPAVKRLKTEEGKLLGDVVTKTDSDAWWFGEKNDEWWVGRNKNV